jgi:hypothetical protein
MWDNGGANAICSAQKVRNCEANTNLNGYNMPYTNHKATTSTLTKTLPISNWKQIYQTTFKCNDGTFEQNTETITNVECNTNYTANQETKTCVADTKTFICEAKPDNTIWNMWSNNGSYTQIRNGAGRSPPNTNTTYNTISSSNECNYICETNYTWDSLNNSCDDCTAYTLNSCPTHANCSSCANGKYKIESCKDNYTWANCEVEPEITAKNSCTSRWQILSAGSRFTNKDWIAYNAWVQCDTNDIIVCTWSWAWLTLAACNVWARYATGITSSYTTDNVWLHFQRWSSTGYLSENTYTLSTSYNYPVDSWLVKGSGSKSDKWNQWPCPASYHIPDWNEWIRLLEAWNWWWWTLWAKKNDPIFNYRSWSSWWNDFRTALKLPAAGRRKSSSFNNIGSAGRYWSTSTMSEWVMRMLHFWSSSVIPDDYRPRRHGYSIRCFKD